MFLHKEKNQPVIPTSSMADIAFLLLIFFLIVTVIDVDTGIGLTLPEYTDEPPKPVKENRLVTILINANNEILIDNAVVSLISLKDNLKKRISDKIDLPKNQKLIISLKTDSNTKYQNYIAVLDQVKLAYHNVRNEYSALRYGHNFSELNDSEQKQIEEAIPIIISIAEPIEIK